MFEAVPQGAGLFPGCKFFISGEGPEKDAVVHRAHELGVTLAIRFLGNFTRKEYSEVLRSVVIVAVPSRNEHLDLVALEAWAAGKPVVASTAGGPREYVGMM